MDQQGTIWPVLARIPDLNIVEPDGAMDGEVDSGLSAACHRLLNQSLSFKLLAGLALVLMVAAVVPVFSRQNAPVADPATVADDAPPWHGNSAAAPVETAAPRAGAPRPATLVSATPERSPAPAIVPSAAELKPELPPAAEVPLMSAWPNPGHPISPEKGGGGERPSAARSPEYQADARAGGRPEQARAAQSEGSIEPPAVRNSYDRTRPGAD